MKMMTSHLVFLLLFMSCSRPGSNVPEEAPKEAGHDTGKLIEMMAEAQEHAGVQVSPVAVRQLQDHLQVTGTVQPVDTRVGHVRPIANGRLVEVRVRVGDRVSHDSVLASFDNIEAGDLAAQYRSARAELQRQWAQFDPVNRTSCVEETGLGGYPSYVEVLTCLQMYSGTPTTALKLRRRGD